MSDTPASFRLRVTISPYWDAARLAETLQPDAVISILGPGADRLAPLAFPGVAERAVLRLYFDDVLAADSTRGGPARPAVLQAPNRAHMEALAGFLESIGARKYLVHCRAGVSRSVAVGMVVADWFGATAEALRGIRFGRTFYKPSRAVLSEWRRFRPRPDVDLLAIAAETRPAPALDPWAPATFELYD